MTTVNVVYLGRKPFKQDNVAGTGIVWRGYGDIQRVPVTALAKILEHPAVWAVADDADLTPPAPSAAQQSIVAAAAEVATESVRSTATVPEATTQREAEKVVFVLLAGSNHPDSVFNIAPGIEVQRDDAITHTFRGTGLSPADWNALSADGRTAYVDDYLQYRADRQDAVEARAKFAASLQSLKPMDPPPPPSPEQQKPAGTPAPDDSAAPDKGAGKAAAGRGKPKGAGKAAA
ncbi:MAG: hypothetical protein WAQ08_16120 [Aquabacterium sp.]|uniref:hypothetical protein n=1 Tax=Aquabacterium sp. TaxID=1872578 RepID=UPI003BAE2320